MVITVMKRKRLSILVGLCIVFVIGLSGKANAFWDPIQLKKFLTLNQCVECDLSSAHLAGLNMSGANLAKADLSGAHFSESNLIGADLSGANLV